MTTTLLAYIPSPSQGVWHFFGVPLRAYALFIIVGIIAALVLGDRRWVARGGEPGVIYDVALWAVPFGLIGGRLYHVITDWRTYFGDDGAGLAAAFRIWDGGLGIWGAVALGGVGAWIACRRHGIPLPAFGDAIAPGIILAQAIGRLGNYFNQELYGRPTDLPWGLEIYERRNADGVLDSLNGVSTGRLIEVVHPTFLYELLWNLLIFAVLILVDRRFKIGHGRLFAMYVAGYCLGRFWIELMRSDAATLLAGIRVNTFTSTFVFIGAVVYIMAAPKGREDPATLKGKQEAEPEEVGDVEDFVQGLAVGASTTGVVAAATVASEDDEKSVVESADLEAEAEALSADIEESEPGDDEVEPAEVAEADSETEAGGLGSVEGDEVAEAAEGASAVHDAVVDGEADAEALAAEVEAEEVTDGSDSDADAETRAGESGESDEPVAADDADTAAEEDDEDGSDESVADADESEAEAGLGSVDGDEVAAAVEDAPEAHEVVVEGEADADALAAEVAAEESDDSAAEVDESTDEPEAGVESVDGDEVAEAVEGEAEAEALAAPVEAEESGEADAGTEAAGLGAVEGDEVAAAVDDASEAHEVAVEGEADAEALAGEVELRHDRWQTPTSPKPRLVWDRSTVMRWPRPLRMPLKPTKLPSRVRLTPTLWLARSQLRSPTSRTDRCR